MHILIADDDEQTRLLLSLILTSRGHTVLEAKNGNDAWEALLANPVEILISDWMMPEMDGLELSKKIRKYPFDTYIYIILLTSRNKQGDLLAGIEAGADEFMTKPVQKEELQVRLIAAERIIQLQKSLAIKNQNLEDLNKKLERAYMRMSYDLESAAAFQKHLLPKPISMDDGKLTFDWLFFPSDFVAGDMFNYFQLDQEHTAFYLLDVSGHGVASAMLSFTLHTTLIPDSSLLVDRNDAETSVISPARVAETLNRLHLHERDFIAKYFTMIYGVLNTRTNCLRLLRAGHPAPILISRDGTVSQIEMDNPAIALLAEPCFVEREVTLNAGDRLYLYTDGITECQSRAGTPFGEARLLEILVENNSKSMQECLKELSERLTLWLDGKMFEDDVSVLGIELNR